MKVNWQSTAAIVSICVVVGGTIWSRASAYQTLKSDRTAQEKVQSAQRKTLEGLNLRMREMELKGSVIDQHTQDILSLRLAITEIQNSQFTMATGIAEMRSDINTLIRTVERLVDGQTAKTVANLDDGTRSSI